MQAMISITGATHPGKRDHNEDSFIADTANGLGLVADGMGGYACGEVASELVKVTVAEAIDNNEGLNEAFARAHAVVKENAEADKNKKGMGSTAIAFKMRELDYELAWVGDSRAYLWCQRQKALKQLTRDHSYVETLLSSGAISEQEAVNHPNRNLITQAIGVAGDDGLLIEVISGRLAAGQQLLICSDGLVDEVVDQHIAEIMSTSESAEEIVEQLINQAVINGGRDNITVVIATANTDLGQEAIEPDIVRCTQIVSQEANDNPEQQKQAFTSESASAMTKSIGVDSTGNGEDRTTEAPLDYRSNKLLAMIAVGLIAVGLLLAAVMG